MNFMIHMYNMNECNMAIVFFHSYLFYHQLYRLKESVNRNTKITDELRVTKREHTTLQQRVEEEQQAVVDKSPDGSNFKRQGSDRIHAKQIMQMKDHLVELERTVSYLSSWGVMLYWKKKMFSLVWWM